MAFRSFGSRLTGRARTATVLAMAGLMVLPTAAFAADPATSGICNGVVNQTAHRGSVQENLLRAAARKNAELIAGLQAQRAVLQTRADTLTAQIAAAEKLIADLTAANVELDKQIVDATTQLKTVTDAQTAKATEIADAEKALAALRLQKTAVETALAPLQKELADAEKARTTLKAAADAVDAQITAKKGDITTATNELAVLEAAALKAGQDLADKYLQIQNAEGELAKLVAAAVKAAVPALEAAGVRFCYLPPYSPELNPIELVWRQAKYQDLPERSHPTDTALQAAVDAALAERGRRLAQPTKQLPRPA